MKKPHVFKGVFIGLFISSFIWAGIYQAVSFISANYEINKVEKDNSKKEIAVLNY